MSWTEESRELMIKERTAMEIRLRAEMDDKIEKLKDEYKISHFNHYIRQRDRTERAYFDLMYWEGDAIEQKHGFPPRKHKMKEAHD